MEEYLQGVTFTKDKQEKPKSKNGKGYNPGVQAKGFHPDMVIESDGFIPDPDQCMECGSQHPLNKPCPRANRQTGAEMTTKSKVRENTFLNPSTRWCAKHKRWYSSKDGCPECKPKNTKNIPPTPVHR
ncbi:hypothetical protein ACFL0F_00950 [Patescibacteria group bacterium]